MVELLTGFEAVFGGCGECSEHQKTVAPSLANEEVELPVVIQCGDEPKLFDDKVDLFAAV